MDYKIEYNKAIEFISAVLKYSRSMEQQINWKGKDQEEDMPMDMLDFCPTKEIKEWLKYVNDDISPFLKNDILLFPDAAVGLHDTCYKIILNNNLEDYQAFMETLEAIDVSKFIELIYWNYDLDIPLSSENELIKEKLTELHNEGVASYFLQIKKHPEEYKSRVIRLFKTFYELYYKPFEDKVYDFMENKCKEMNEAFKNNFLEFVNTIGIGDYSEIILQNKKFRLFISYYIDVGMFNFYDEDTFLMFCGYSTEEKYNSNTMQENAKELFKALADDKRLEIIKIACKRPWYNKELADYFHLSPATLSYHINLLLDLGILNFEPSIDNKYYYKTNVDNLKKIFQIALKYIID